MSDPLTQSHYFYPIWVWKSHMAENFQLKTYIFIDGHYKLFSQTIADIDSSW